MADPIIEGAAPKAPTPAAPPEPKPAEPPAPVAVQAKPPEPAPAPAAPVKPEPPKAPEPVVVAPAAPLEPAVLKRIEAIEARDARAKRDATLDYLLRPEMGCRLTRQQLDAVLPPTLSAETVEGRGAIDKWGREPGNANLFVPLEPRPDQIAGQLSAKLATTYKDNPALAERAARLTRSVFGGGR